MIELIIGRESGVEKPRLAVYNNGQTTFLGTPGSVPKGVSRKHCKVIVNDDSSMLIEDITDNNFMFINGVDCKRKKNVSVNDTIELGPTRFPLDLNAILKTFSSKQVFNIRHLKKIQDDYQREKLEMQVKQGKMNAASMLPGIISMFSMLLMVVWQSTLPRIILGTLAVGGMIFFMILRSRTAESNPKKMREMEENYRDTFICPNPACHHFLGQTPYKELIKNKACPYCKAKFTE